MDKKDKKPPSRQQQAAARPKGGRRTNATLTRGKCFYRALQEAAKRRENNTAPKLPIEKNGRVGVEPTRYGDWEKNGIISDF